MASRADFADIDRLLPRLFGYALALTADRHEAEDLTHDCLARALGTPCPPRPGALSGWLFAILRNLHLDARRRAGRRPAAALLDGTDPPADVRSEARLVEAIAVREALEDLSPAHREVLVLIDVRGCSYAEAARLLAVSQGTVTSRIARARAALLHALREDG